MFKGEFDSDEGWSFDCGPVADAGNEAVIAEILIEDSGGVFRVVPGGFLDDLREIEGI